MKKTKIKLHAKRSKLKLIVFDYDNTLKLPESIVKQHTDYTSLEQYEKDLIQQLNKLRKLKIKIFINTGRSFYSFIKDNNFYYDYLSCNNGCEMYDHQNNLLYSKPLDEKDIHLLNNIKPSPNYEIKTYYAKNLTTTNNLIAVSIRYFSEDGFHDFIKYLKSILNNTDCFYKYPKIRLVNAKINKQYSVRFVMKRLHLSYDEVCAIGDDDNDYVMLKNNRSFTMQWQSEKIKSLGLMSFDNIVQFIKYLGKQYEQ